MSNQVIGELQRHGKRLYVTVNNQGTLVQIQGRIPWWRCLMFAIRNQIKPYEYSEFMAAIGKT